MACFDQLGDSKMTYGRDYNFYSNRSESIKTIGVILLGAIVLFFPVDCCVGCAQGKWQPKFGKVTDKRIETSTSTRTDSDGHRHTSTSTDYVITFDVHGYCNTTTVSHSDFNNVKVGDEIQVEQRIGGFTGFSYGYGFKNKVTGLPSER